MAKVHVYGMRVRGFSPGAQPKDGWVDTETDPLDEYWNILVYSRKLSREDCNHYDLDYLGARKQ